MVDKLVNAATYREATAELAASEKPYHIVEVGVYAGGLSQELVEKVPTMEQLTLIDPWAEGYGNFPPGHMNEVAKSVESWAAVVNRDYPGDDPLVVIHRQKSVDAAHDIMDVVGEPWIDFFHTDGDHDYEEVLVDLEAWRPHVKPDCLMTGDNANFPGVKKAIEEVFGDRLFYPEKAKGRLWAVRV